MTTRHPSEPCDLDVTSAAQLLRARQLSSIELLDSVLARLDRTEPQVHAYVEVLEDQARQSARECDEELANGASRGPVHGIPIAIKDIYDVANVPTRCGSRARQDAPPATEDAVTVNLLRRAGAVILGKTVTQEFAAGVVSPPARNPWDPSRIPGGSSGGTAAAIAAGSALAGMGSDTGGSIRIPAALCGIVGFKPTFGVLSTEGIFPLSWSLDTAGPMTRTVDDAELLYQVLRGEPEAPVGQSGRRDLRIGVPRPHFFDRLQPGVAAAVEAAIESLKSAGVSVIETPWPEASTARACSFIINRVETAAVHIQYLEERGESYGDELRRRIESNALFPAAGYVKALQARTVIKRSTARLFDEHRLDALVTPATPGTAAPADHTYVDHTDGSEEHVSLAYTRLSMPFNVTGQPAMSIPCGFDERGMPVGLQIAGRPYDEQVLCALGRLAEDAIGLDALVPPVVAAGRANSVPFS
jgi:aspartyl-tRNA(Asn)/glutamyl-tRNA(Gln) amidotransferase subunit A